MNLSASLPSGVTAVTSLPSARSLPRAGCRQKQGEASTQSHPLLKIQPGVLLSARSCTQLLPAESRYSLTFAKVTLLLQAFEKSTFKHVCQQQPPLSSSSPSGWGTRGAGTGSQLAPAFRGFAEQQRFVSSLQGPIETCQLRGSTKHLSRRDLTFSFVLISIVRSPSRRLCEAIWC